MASTTANFFPFVLLPRKVRNIIYDFLIPRVLDVEPFLFETPILAEEQSSEYRLLASPLSEGHDEIYTIKAVHNVSHQLRTELRQRLSTSKILLQLDCREAPDRAQNIIIPGSQDEADLLATDHQATALIHAYGSVSELHVLQSHVMLTLPRLHLAQQKYLIASRLGVRLSDNGQLLFNVTAKIIRNITKKSDANPSQDGAVVQEMQRCLRAHALQLSRTHLHHVSSLRDPRSLWRWLARRIFTPSIGPTRDGDDRFLLFSEADAQQEFASWKEEFLEDAAGDD